MSKQRIDSSKTYLWCDQCRRSFRHEESPDGTCPICGSHMQPTGKMSAILRGLMANELAASPIVTKHRQIVRLIWTRNGQGEEYYRLLQPQIPLQPVRGAGDRSDFPRSRRGLDLDRHPGRSFERRAAIPYRIP